MCLSLTALYAVLLATIPLGETLITKLENRFLPNKSLPKVVEGIIVLGGVVDQFISQDRGTIAINGAVERLTAFADLSKRYPQARLVFSGGSGVLFEQELMIQIDKINADNLKMFFFRFFMIYWFKLYHKFMPAIS